LFSFVVSVWGKRRKEEQKTKEVSYWNSSLMRSPTPWYFTKG
jgi:hypothetical protein